MPRQARIDAPEALQHVVVRGIERQRIFRDDADRESLLSRLGQVLMESGVACYAWAFMPNHMHLLLKTGPLPIATAMQRILTGYAVGFNRRHRRHGHLFQNRYKSILCQEDPYLLELVRYIHLNPLRAMLVSNLEDLDRYPYTGHCVLMGRCSHPWQDTASVLSRFARGVGPARRAYRDFVKAGVPLGRRPELVGGGLIRSLGGWAEAAKVLRQGATRVKSDERILGDSDFVLAALEASKEHLTPAERMQWQGYDIQRIARRAADIFRVTVDDIFTTSKQPRFVAARSLFCYWAVRELGETATGIARRLRLSQPAVSVAVRRGAVIAKVENVQLSGE